MLPRAPSSSPSRRVIGCPSAQLGRQEVSAEAAPEAHELETLMATHSNGHVIPLCGAGGGITSPETRLAQSGASCPTEVEAELQSLMSASQYHRLDCPPQLIKTTAAEEAPEWSEETQVANYQTLPCTLQQQLPHQADLFNHEDSYSSTAAGHAQNPEKDIYSETEHCPSTACTEIHQREVRNGNGDMGVPALGLCVKDLGKLSSAHERAHSSDISTAKAATSEPHLESAACQSLRAASLQRLSEAGLSPHSRNKRETLHIITTSALIHHNP